MTEVIREAINETLGAEQVDALADELIARFERVKTLTNVDEKILGLAGAILVELGDLQDYNAAGAVASAVVGEERTREIGAYILDNTELPQLMQVLDRIAEAARNLVRPRDKVWPLIYSKYGKQYAEYSDGTIYHIRDDGSFKRITLRRHVKRKLDKNVNSL